MGITVTGATIPNLPSLELASRPRSAPGPTERAKASARQTRCRFQSIIRDCCTCHRNRRTTRAGERAVELKSSSGRVKDISPTRVKESYPKTDPRAPPGTMQRVKFENAQPGSKDFKRDPTPTEQRITNMPEKPGLICRYTGLMCKG